MADSSYLYKVPSFPFLPCSILFGFRTSIPLNIELHYVVLCLSTISCCGSKSSLSYHQHSHLEMLQISYLSSRRDETKLDFILPEFTEGNG